MEPSCLSLWRTGRLAALNRKLQTIMSACSLCPRRCGVDRSRDETGVCGAGKFPVVASHGPHFGEERPLVGMQGSGTIFMTHCNLLCVFCQNYDISHFAAGKKTSVSQLAAMMLDIQSSGCHNLNIVTPTHVVPHIVDALDMAIQRGFRLPIVYNCGGYENIDIIRMLDGVIDIYMPDVKFLDNERSRRYLQAEDYPDTVREVIREMHRQVGDLSVDREGIARRGLLVRHLVMPDTPDSELRTIFHFLADEISCDTYINIMAQYRPLYRARDYPEINRQVTFEEYQRARELAREAGLHRGFEE